MAVSEKGKMGFQCYSAKRVKEELEKRIRLLQKDPCYYHSFAGHYIFQKYYRSKRLNYIEAQILVIMSYHKLFFKSDIKYWRFNEERSYVAFRELINMNYIMETEVLSPGIRRKKALILTPKGLEFEKGYEAYFDEMMHVFSKEPNGSDINFEKNKYYRKKRKADSKKRYNDYIDAKAKRRQLNAGTSEVH